ncbi:hypothetical protein, partial [Pseudomonas aeruginosa]|uniref:hypothetical protein n=1 Tax=Pseudomonas aeruginosa TaxID=287 RepID=UPI003D2CBC73
FKTPFAIFDADALMDLHSPSVMSAAITCHLPNNPCGLVSSPDELVVFIKDGKVACIGKL